MRAASRTVAGFDSPRESLAYRKRRERRARRVTSDGWPAPSVTAVRLLERRGWRHAPELDIWTSPAGRAMSGAFAGAVAAEHGVLALALVMRETETTGRDVWSREAIDALVKAVPR